MAGPTEISIVMQPGWGNRLMTVLTLTAVTGLFNCGMGTDHWKRNRQRNILIIFAEWYAEDRTSSTPLDLYQQKMGFFLIIITAP
jgi:preprotein translocase subunit SecY